MVSPSSAARSPSSPTYRREPGSRRSTVKQASCRRTARAALSRDGSGSSASGQGEVMQQQQLTLLVVPTCATFAFDEPPHAAGSSDTPDAPASASP
jgi:hypothetical protein